MNLKDFLQDTKKLCILSCVLLIFIIIIFFFSQSFALFLYDYSSSIVLGTSEGKVITILFWLLFTFFLSWASLQRNWKSFNFKLLFSIFLILIFFISLVNIAAFNSEFAKINASKLSGKSLLLTVEPKMNIYMGFSRLEHTHSLKPILYKILNVFTNTEASSFDMGGSLHEFFVDWVFFPTLFLTLAYFIVYGMLVIYTAKKLRGIYALFTLFILGLASLSFFITIFDAGPLSSGTGITLALLTIYFLLNYLKEFKVKWIFILMFLPLTILAIFNLFIYFIVSHYAMSFESHLIISVLSLASVLLYGLSYQFKYRTVLLLILIFILAINLLTFKPYAWVQKSIKGDNIYIQRPLAVEKDDVFKKLEKVPGITNLETIVEREKVFLIRGDVEKTGLTTTYVAEKIVEKKLTSMAANFIIVFVDPKIEWNFTVYLPANQINETQVPVFLDPLVIHSVRRADENYIEINYSSPAGLDWRHSIQFFNKYMNVTYMIVSRFPQGKNPQELIKDFVFTLIPITSAQIKAYELTS